MSSPVQQEQSGRDVTPRWGKLYLLRLTRPPLSQFHYNRLQPCSNQTTSPGSAANPPAGNLFTTSVHLESIPTSQTQLLTTSIQLSISSLHPRAFLVVSTAATNAAAKGVSTIAAGA